MVLAKEWNALNSGLLKQLFDRHYVLAERKAEERESMWLVPPLISDTMSGDARREYTLRLIFRSCDPRKMPK